MNPRVLYHIARADFLPLHERILRAKTADRRRLPGLGTRTLHHRPRG